MLNDRTFNDRVKRAEDRANEIYQTRGYIRQSEIEQILIEEGVLCGVTVLDHKPLIDFGVGESE